MAKPPNILLETGRMYFREFRADDAARLFELDSDPEVMRYITKGRPTPLAKIEGEVIPRFLNYHTQTPPRGFWAAHLGGTDEFIGWFHLRPDRIVPEEMELGYRLKRHVWGRGLATEGSRALIRRAFAGWGYEKICASTMALNLASRRVMEKAGLVLESEFYYDIEIANDWIEKEERRAVKYSVMRGAGDSPAKPS
jgi:RimJ/RimL family protein N-acetyltransferase